MNNDEILIKVEGVSKKYCKDLQRSLRYGLQELAGELFLRQHPSTDLRRHEFWALQDVNFELKRGESFGIIGVNGSGKTTLLKMMQGLLKPTRGQISMRGQVGALISLGAGFQPLLTGRENVYVNASILRVPKWQVDQRMNEILAFADIGDFIDAPIKTYSTGMRGRLGFAVATHLIDPDILLLDEVMAAGDWKFKDRCFRRMEEIVSSGATVVIVSHLVPKIEKFCNRAMLLHKGVVKGIGASPEICQMYYDLPEIESAPNPRNRRRRLAKMLKLRSDDNIQNQTQRKNNDGESGLEINPEASDIEPIQESDIDVVAVELLSAENILQDIFHTLDPLIMRVYISLHSCPKTVEVVIQFLTPGDELSVSYFPAMFTVTPDPESKHSSSSPLPSASPITIDCTVPQLLLREGKYRVSVSVTAQDDEMEQSHSTFTTMETLSVKDKVSESENNHGKQKPGLVYMPSTWQINSSTSPILLSRQEMGTLLE